jgi:hypothetical protein
MEEFNVVPAFAGGWAAVAAALARKAASAMQPDRWHYLIVEAGMEGAPFVQLAVHSSLVLAEVRADRFAACGPILDARVAEAMLACGWNAPDDEPESCRCNWWQEWSYPSDMTAICGHLLALFVVGFDVPEDVVVTLKAFPGDDLCEEEQPA